eukprot:scaffold169824_cov28-Tisochrysis_lutea.AAC.3
MLRRSAASGSRKSSSSGSVIPYEERGRGRVSGNGNSKSSTKMSGTHRQEMASKSRPVDGVSPAATAQYLAPAISAAVRRLSISSQTLREGSSALLLHARILCAVARTLAPGSCGSVDSRPAALPTLRRACRTAVACLATFGHASPVSKSEAAPEK